MSDIIQEKEFITEYIDDEGNYLKVKGREIEQIGFFLRFIHEHFIPCKECQKKLLHMVHNAKTWTLGNKDYEPLVELWKEFEIDDKAFIELEKHKATKEELEKYGE